MITVWRPYLIRLPSSARRLGHVIFFGPLDNIRSTSTTDTDERHKLEYRPKGRNFSPSRWELCVVQSSTRLVVVRCINIWMAYRWMARRQPLFTRNTIFIPVISMYHFVDLVGKRHFSCNAILIHVTQMFVFETILQTEVRTSHIGPSPHIQKFHCHRLSISSIAAMNVRTIMLGPRLGIYKTQLNFINMFDICDTIWLELQRIPCSNAY